MKQKFVNNFNNYVNFIKNVKFRLIWTLKIKAIKSKSKKDVTEYKKQHSLVVKLKNGFKKVFFDKRETKNNSKLF